MAIRKRKWKSRGIERSAWVVDYFDQSGKRHIKTFATRKESDQWSVIARSQVKQGIHTAGSASITVAECGKRWLEHCEVEGLELSTILSRRQHLDLHINPFLGGEKLWALTVPRVNSSEPICALMAAQQQCAARYYPALGQCSPSHRVKV